MIPFSGVSISWPASPSGCPSFLQPELASGGGRVLHVSSLGHRHGKVDIDNLNRHPVYSIQQIGQRNLFLIITDVAVYPTCLLGRKQRVHYFMYYRGPGFLAVQ
jgi:hypothetical protein